MVILLTKKTEKSRRDYFKTLSLSQTHRHRQTDRHTHTHTHTQTHRDTHLGFLTLEYGGVLDDETLELRADSLQARLHVVAGGYLVAFLHLLGAAGRPFGLAHLQVGTWQPAGAQTQQGSQDQNGGQGAARPCPSCPSTFFNTRGISNSFIYSTYYDIHHVDGMCNVRTGAWILSQYRNIETVLGKLIRS